MKDLKTTIVGAIAGVAFLAALGALIIGKIDLSTFGAVSGGIATFAVTLLGILGADSKKPGDTSGATNTPA